MLTEHIYMAKIMFDAKFASLKMYESFTLKWKSIENRYKNVVNCINSLKKLNP